MPRKPQPKTEKITVLVNSQPVGVTLYSPRGNRKTWYAYWSGLEAARSTKQGEFVEAVRVVEAMLKNGGSVPQPDDELLSDEEFDEIQRRHFEKKTDPKERERSMRTLRSCMEAIRAFRQISGVRPISIATPDDCERFQQEALKLPKNWRVAYAENTRSKRRRAKRGPLKKLSPNTVVRWSVALRAAFERANRNAGQKCVRGVVSNDRLLTENPWRQFSWIKGQKKPKRQFDHNELLLLLDFWQHEWPGITFAPAFVKVCLWSWGRRVEISSLKWDQLQIVGHETHFDSVGKWGVRKWFRIPEKLFHELKQLKCDSPYVFGCYPEQLRQFHLERGSATTAHRVVDDFTPENLGDWMYRQIRKWSEGLPKGSAYLHDFRRTSLQYARSGEDVNRQVATDASLTTAVMMTSYADETDDELRHKSNRTFARIKASLPLEVASRYGCEEKPSDLLIERLDAARSQKDWSEVARLCEALLDLQEDETGG